jgi:hypothetical protein
VVKVAEHRVLRQRAWSEDELERAGFHYYAPVKRLVMAKLLTQTMNIEVTLEVLTAKTGDVVVYAPGDETQDELDDYDHWPVRRDLFNQTYKRWDEPDWRPNTQEQFLMRNGCLPFYKWKGIWSLLLPYPIYVQSLESPEPIIVPKGRWLCIGSQGEPYNMSDEDFRERYVVS